MNLQLIALLTLGLLVSTSARANEAHRILIGMSDEKRGAALADTVRSAGERCDSAKRTFYQGQHKDGSVFWNIECRQGGAWVIQIKADRGGSTSVLSCGVLKALNAGSCFKKFN